MGCILTACWSEVWLQAWCPVGPVVAEGTHSPVTPQDEDKAEPRGRTCSQPSPGSEHCR